MSIGKQMLSILPLMLMGESSTTSKLSDEELDEILGGLPSASNMKYGKGYQYSGDRDENMTEEELEYIRSLSKKERKAYMTNRRRG